MFERAFEIFLFRSRWLLAPFYVALIFALFALVVKLLQEVAHLALHLWEATEAQTVLGVLTLVDMSFTASLLIIVLFSSYENFVSKFNHISEETRPSWMGTIDFTGLKLKLISSIVAISAIQLLKAFMDVKNTSDRELAWLVGVHMVFVFSGLMMAWTDRTVAGHHDN